MKKLITLLAVIATIQGFGQVNKGMPGIMEVVNKFFTTYVPPDTLRYIIQFQKKCTGWYVAEFDGKTWSVNNPPKLFWDKAKQLYNNLDYQPNDHSDSSLQQYAKGFMTNYVDDQKQYEYNRDMFFGYDGWEKEMIAYASKQPFVTDSILESLAYAYTNIAVGYILGTDNPAFEGDTDIIAFNSVKQLNASRLKKFITYQNKAIDTYKKLYLTNANYKTKWGNGSVSINNGKVYGYMMLKIFGHEKEGLLYLKDILFADSIILRAKKVLEKVEPNGIVFLDGDNLISAVYYLQHIGLRRDITAIPFVLFQFKMVTMYFDNESLHGLFDTDSSAYMDDAFGYARFEDGYFKDKQFPLDSFLIQLYNSPIVKTLQKDGQLVDYNNDGTYKFFTKNIYLSVDKSKAAKLFQTSIFADKLYFSITSRYLIIDELLELAIIQKNFCRRHIYFSFAPKNRVYWKYCWQRGPIWELTPEIH